MNQELLTHYFYQRHGKTVSSEDEFNSFISHMARLYGDIVYSHMYKMLWNDYIPFPLTRIENQCKHGEYHG